MIITTKVNLTYYPNVYIPAGSNAIVLTKKEADRLPKSDRDEIYRMRIRRERLKAEGVFALLEGKYRWVNREDYE
jgi:hypothetical protein